jgi:hypothetical protein
MGTIETGGHLVDEKMYCSELGPGPEHGLAVERELEIEADGSS